MNYLISVLIIFSLFSCSKKDEDIQVPAAPVEIVKTINGYRSLFIASGSCYAGGVTTSTGSAVVSAYNVNTGAYIRTIIDYNSYSPGDMPIAVAEYDDYNLLILVENSSGRRIDLVKKDGSSVNVYLLNTTALSAAVRSLIKLSDGSLLISKSSAIEKFSAGKVRVLQGSNPFINAPAGSCATATTLLSSVYALSNGKILFTHASTSPNNKFGIISSNGYSTSADCLAAQSAPNSTALPTGILQLSSGKVLVSYGSTTASSNFIYSYDVDSSTSSISNAVIAFNDYSIINGPSAVTEDPVDKSVYIANGLSGYNNIEKFSFDATTGLLTRIGSRPFIGSTVYSRCIAGMKVLFDPY